MLCFRQRASIQIAKVAIAPSTHPKMPLRCPSCLSTNPDANRFCGQCGTLLHAGGELASPVSQSSGLEVQWGALKQATILFADIVSSTEHVAGLDPEEAMEQLRPAVQRMCNAVERFGGTVVRTLGDGVMALFGVPRALEGHASLACEAALAMQAAFEGPQEHLRIRVGLHSGQVAMDTGAADAAKGGGVHGHAIHLASRVVALAEPGGICLTADCLALVRAACDVRPMGKHPLKGIAEPVELHALLGLRNDVQSHQFHEAAMSAFRGRERELGILQEALALAEEGHGSVIGLSGAPGTGKSRLCHEFAQWCRIRSVPVFEVRTQLYGHATPLQPVLMLLRTCFFRISPVDTPATARQRISDGLLALTGVVADDLALFNEFLGVADINSPPCSLSPKARHGRLLGLLGELVRHAGAKPAVIIFEDLHWLDEASDAFLSALVDAVAGTRTLLLLNYRPLYKAPWSERPHFRAVALADLGVADTEALVREQLGRHPELEQFFGLIVERSAGNPFFAEELVHSLIEKSASLKTGEGATPDLASLGRALPATVQAVIGERLDRLVATQKTLLHICAVIGKEIPLAVLQEVAVYLVSQMESGLDGLCEAELLQLLREITGGRRFAFRHPLIQEVAYSTQLKARRANLHAAVAAAMEVHYSAQEGEFAALVAYHYAAAGQFVNAAQHEARAAKWAGSTNSAQAIKHWRKVRSLLFDQAQDTDIDRLRAMACSQISLLGWREGLSLSEVQPFIDEAMELASRVDSRLTQLLLMVEGRMLQASGGPADGYVQRVQQALSLIPAGSDFGRAAILNAALSQAYGWAGLLEQGLAANDVALAGVHSVDKFDREFMGFSIEQWLLGLRGRLLTRLGRFEEAHDCFQQMVLVGEHSTDPTILQIAHHGYVDLACSREDIDLAQKHAGLIQKLDEKHAIPYLRAFSLSSRGMAATVKNDFSTALGSFEEALQLIRVANVAPEYETEILANIAECFRRLGDFEQSSAYANEAIELSRKRSTRLPECRALITRGAVLVDSHGVSRAAEAGSIFDEAERLIQLTGARIFDAVLRTERTRLVGLFR